MMLNCFQLTNISLYCSNFFFLFTFVIFTIEAFNTINSLHAKNGRNVQKELVSNSLRNSIKILTRVKDKFLANSLAFKVTKDALNQRRKVTAICSGQARSQGVTG